MMIYNNAAIEMSPSARQDRNCLLFYLTFAVSLSKVYGLSCSSGCYECCNMLCAPCMHHDAYMAAGVAAGVAIVGLMVVIYKGIKRYVFKIKSPPKSLFVDKKVKCTSGKTQFFYFNKIHTLGMK